MTTAENLIEKIDSKSLTVSTDSLDISFGEIVSMYDDHELEIRPAYQRLFRWSRTQQSQFIESLLLGLPIPPIFVIETEARKYELIDGLQRISSFLHFMGRLQIREGQSLVLRDCEIVPELNGITFENLSPALRIRLKRSYVRMYIIKKESPSRIKYDMFKRLNTGGSLLEAQEIRNSTIRFLSEDFIDFIQNLSKDDNFRKSISYVQDFQIDRQFDDELVLRFFTIKNADFQRYSTEEDGDTLAHFMTKYAEDVADGDVDFDYQREEQIFRKTFLILNSLLGPESFSSHKENGMNPFTRQFHAFEYEAISVGVSNVCDRIDLSDQSTKERLREKLIELKGNQEYKDATENKKHKRTSGSKYIPFLKKRLELAFQFLSEV